MIEDSNSEVTCTSKLTMGGETIALENVVYSSAATPVVSRISPRFGSVAGGDQITI